MTLLIFFSDLSVSCKLYANDAKLYSSYSMNSQDLNVAIDRLLLWSSQWQLKIANEKYLVLRIRNQRCISTCLHATCSHHLNTVSEVRDLGVIVDSSSKFDKHISLVVRKTQQRAGLIMVALWNRAGRPLYFHAVICSFFFFFFSSPNLSRRRLDVCHTSTHGVALVRI